jgi:hypothetical protein
VNLPLLSEGPNVGAVARHLSYQGRDAIFWIAIACSAFLYLMLQRGLRGKAVSGVGTLSPAKEHYGLTDGRPEYTRVIS